MWGHIYEQISPLEVGGTPEASDQRSVGIKAEGQLCCPRVGCERAEAVGIDGQI
jgi:hypothetical protein